MRDGHCRLSKRAFAAAALLMGIGLPIGSAGCSRSATSSAVSSAASRDAPPAPPTASEIQARIRQVQADPKLPADSKALLIREMQHALGNPQRGTGGPAAPVGR